MLRVKPPWSATVRLLDERDRGAVLAICDRDPVTNVFVGSRVRALGLTPGRLGAPGTIGSGGIGTPGTIGSGGLGTPGPLGSGGIGVQGGLGSPPPPSPPPPPSDQQLPDSSE